MEAKANYTLVGLFVVIFTAAAFFLAIWLTAGRSNKHYRLYQVYIREPISGLNVDSPVEFNGVHVGYVRKIDLDYQDPQRVKILLAIERRVPITTSTAAKLRAQGITGISYVGLVAKKAHAPPLRAKASEPYPVIPAEPSFLLQLDIALRDVAKTINNVGQGLTELLGKNNQAAFAASLNNIQQVSATLAKRSQQLDNMLVSADTVLQQTAKASKRLPALAQRLSQSLSAIQAMAQRLSRTSLSVNKTMQSGQIAFRQVSQQTLPELNELTHELNDTARQAQLLLKELRAQPNALLRGRSVPAYGPGER